MLTDLSGQIERITYTNPDNGFTIAQVKIQGRGDLVTVVGHFMAPTPGEILKMQGEWTTHPKFGEQLMTRSYVQVHPSTIEGIRTFLGSGRVRGIGPRTAERSTPPP